MSSGQVINGVVWSSAQDTGARAKYQHLRLFVGTKLASERFGDQHLGFLDFKPLKQIFDSLPLFLHSCFHNNHNLPLSRAYYSHIRA